MNKKVIRIALTYTTKDPAVDQTDLMRTIINKLSEVLPNEFDIDAIGTPALIVYTSDPEPEGEKEA